MARDKYHDVVRTALEKDGWTITHDPYVLKFSAKRRREIDLGAEKFIGAERGTDHIVVEVKSFIESSFIYEFNTAFGQYSIYKFFLQKRDPLRKPFLAVPSEIYEKEFSAPDIEEICQEFGLRILVYEIDSQTIVQWIGK